MRHSHFHPKVFVQTADKFHMKTMIKAGRLANGAERGKGSTVHLVSEESSYAGSSLCGTRPSNQWIEREGSQPTCPKCIKKSKEV